MELVLNCHDWRRSSLKLKFLGTFAAQVSEKSVCPAVPTLGAWMDLLRDAPKKRTRSVPREERKHMKIWWKNISAWPVSFGSASSNVSNFEHMIEMSTHRGRFSMLQHPQHLQHILLWNLCDLAWHANRANRWRFWHFLNRHAANEAARLGKGAETSCVKRLEVTWNSWIYDGRTLTKLLPASKAPMGWHNPSKSSGAVNYAGNPSVNEVFDRCLLGLLWLFVYLAILKTTLFPPRHSQQNEATSQ